MTHDQESEGGKEEADSPGVIALPPVIFAAAMAVGVAVEWLSPSTFLASGSRTVAGIFLLAAGVVMIGLGILQHRRSGNDPDPRNPDVTVMTSGIYRCTRNPIYIGYFMIVAGIGVWANSLWVLSTVIPPPTSWCVGALSAGKRPIWRPNSARPTRTTRIRYAGGSKLSRISAASLTHSRPQV